MRSRWSRGLLLSGLVVLVGVAVLGFLLSRPGWLFEDNSPIRNALEALSWVSGIIGLLGAAITTSWRWFRTGHSGSEISSNEPSAAPNLLVGRALHLVDGRLPTVSEVSLLELGVKPAMDTDTERDLPPFVRRDEDSNIEWAIAQGGMILLHGQAASGKSRAALEALRRLRPNCALLVPCDGPGLRALIESDNSFSNAVIWLDDVQRYLASNGLDLATFHRLSPQNENIAIVATMRDEVLSQYDDVSIADSDHYPGTTRASAELVQKLQNRRRVQIDRHLSEAEREQASQQPDHRILDALQGEEGFAEYLAAGRAMFGRWSIGDGELFHLGQAVISAAIDCRRAGYDDPVPIETLKSIHSHYLAPGWRHRSDLPSIEEGVNWACKRVLGASSCLKPRANSTYLAADYLLDSAESKGSPLAEADIPMEVWKSVLSLASSKEAYSIGVMAHRAGSRPIAEWAFRTGAEVGDADAMRGLGILFKQQSRRNEAALWLRKAAKYGNTEAMCSLGIMFREQGRATEADTWFRQGADEGNGLAMSLLGALHEEQGERCNAETWFREGAGRGERYAMDFLGSICEQEGRNDEAERWFRESAGHGSSLAMDALGRIFGERGRNDEAERWFRESAGHDNAGGMFSLGCLLNEQGRNDEAEIWLRKAVGRGDERALNVLGVLLEDKERFDEAESWFWESADRGDCVGMALLGGRCAQQGRSDEAEVWLGKAAELGDDNAMTLLGILVETQERKDEAELWLRKAAEHGNPEGMFSLGTLLEAQERSSEAEVWFCEAADHGNTRGMVFLGRLCEEQERRDEAEGWYLEGAVNGNTTAMLGLGILLDEKGKVDEAEFWYWKADNNGD